MRGGGDGELDDDLDLDLRLGVGWEDRSWLGGEELELDFDLGVDFGLVASCEAVEVLECDVRLGAGLALRDGCWGGLEGGRLEPERRMGEEVVRSIARRMGGEDGAFALPLALSVAVSQSSSSTAPLTVSSSSFSSSPPLKYSSSHSSAFLSLSRCFFFAQLSVGISCAFSPV